MSRVKFTYTLGGCLATVFLLASGLSMNASTTVGSKVAGLANNYNYSPTVIQTGSTQQFWWCSAAASQNQPNGSDGIIYESINSQSGQIVGPQLVLAEGVQGAWDYAFTCNPKVVKGSFTNPLGTGVNFTYAMYYVGTAQADGTLNSIGVAFSNDGITWSKYASPVITYTGSDVGVNGNANKYGIGQPAAYNSNGGSGIWLFFEGNGGQDHFKVTSTDGIHFTNQQILTKNGLQQVQIAGQSSSTPESWGDMAYDSTAGLWYAAYNMIGRPSVTTGGVAERGQVGVIVYSIPNSSLISGATPWKQVTSIDTNLTGYEGNFLSSFLRDSYGNINIGPYPQVEVYSSTSVPAPAWNASPTTRGNSDDTHQWDIAWSVWVPNQPKVAFKRYLGTVHEVTTGYVDTTVFHLESTLGYLYESPQGTATKALYGCLNGSTNYFVSPDSACEGQLFLGINGYASPNAAAGLIPLYRCSTTSDHFVSTSAACEGQTYEQLLGYVPTS
jgi:hypothetical protein